VEILEVKTEDRNGLVHVALMGELDLSTVAKVQEELRRVEAASPPTVVVDLSTSRSSPFSTRPVCAA
jgi:anti-anti-sigma regulatory factor